MQHLNSWICYVAYAGGFATGNYAGMLVDEKLVIGRELTRVITQREATKLADALRRDGFGVTTVKATGMQGEVGVVYIVVTRKNQKCAIKTIQQYNPNAFVTIQAIHCVERSPQKNPLSVPTGPGLTELEGRLLKRKIDL